MEAEWLRGFQFAQRDTSIAQAEELNLEGATFFYYEAYEREFDAPRFRALLCCGSDR